MQQPVNPRRLSEYSPLVEGHTKSLVTHWFWTLVQVALCGCFGEVCRPCFFAGNVPPSCASFPVCFACVTCSSRLSRTQYIQKLKRYINRSRPGHVPRARRVCCSKVSVARSSQAHKAHVLVTSIDCLAVLCSSVGHRRSNCQGYVRDHGESSPIISHAKQISASYKRSQFRKRHQTLSIIVYTMKL